MTQPRPFETLKPPPIETLAVTYLTPLIAPMRVLTRMPPTDPNSELPPANTFIRVEASSGGVTDNGIMFNCQTVIHSYAPYSDEIVAEENIGTALAWMGNAQGTTVTDPTGWGWYVTYSRIVSLGHRVSDPITPMSRYRGAVMWRIAGKPLTA